MILTTVQLRRASCVMDTLVPQVLMYNNVNDNNCNINNEKDLKKKSFVIKELFWHFFVTEE